MAYTTGSADDIEDTNRLDYMIEQRNILLHEHKIDREVIHQAWFIMAHLIMNDDAHIAHMGCGNGELTFAMAALYPHLNFTGLDKNKRKITKANNKFELDNLDYKIGDATSGLFGEKSLDAVIDSNFLHIVYSGSDYNERIVSETLGSHHAMLKSGGQLFIRDFARPPPEEYVLLEMPDEPSASDDLLDLSDADLLVWYAENARPSNDPACGGFFMEELPAQFPKTRLFRLPHKWAYEFIMRKDRRDEWEDDLPTEYTFFTAREMRKSLRALGMRVAYATPYWDEDIIRDKFEGKFRMYRDDGTPMDYPPLSYITVGVKVDERQSLQVVERRPSHSDKSQIKIKTLRNEKNGTLTDVASREHSPSDILPYRIAENGKLKIYLHYGLVRSIVNAVPRTGTNLSQQRWSGHMIEAPAVESHSVPEEHLIDTRSSQKFALDHLGLSTAPGSRLEKGPYFYPAPDYIDERIQCYFLKVQPAKGLIAPLQLFLSSYNFTAKGDIREFDAQQILDAITVGVIPNARLELQILALFEHLKIKPENWTQRQIHFDINEVIQSDKLTEFFDPDKDSSAKFAQHQGGAEQLRCMHSIFVEEGFAGGSVTGVSHQDVDFVLHNDQTENIAVILPLSKNLKNEINAGFLLEQMPVPNRYEGSGATVAALRYPLPPEISNLRLAKKYLAEKLNTRPGNIIKMGEPYFTHIGVTPQKIFPFAAVVPPSIPDMPDAKFLPFYQMMLLRRSLSKDPHFMLLIGRAYRYLNDSLKFEAKIKSKLIVQKSFDRQSPSLSIPLDYYRAPSLPDEALLVKAEADLEAKRKSPLDRKISSKTIILQETDAPLFDPAEEAKPDLVQGAMDQAADTVKALIQPLLKKPNPATTPHLARDFEKELESFMEDLDALDEAAKPQPEKW